MIRAHRRPDRGLRAALGTLAAVVVGAGPALLAPTPAQARSCVTVVVHSSHSCVAAGGSGIAELERAGHTVAFAPRFPGYICQIDGTPTQCANPSDNYWAYFHARPGASWVYSSAGAGSYTPPAGTCDGWRYETGGAQTPPSGTCPAAPPPAPSSPPPTDGGSSSSSGSGSGSSGGSGSAGSSGPGGPGRSGSGGSLPGGSGSTASHTPAPGRSPTPAPTRIPVRSAPPSRTAVATASAARTAGPASPGLAISRHGDSGSGVPWPTLVGVAAVAALASAAAILARKRRTPGLRARERRGRE